MKEQEDAMEKELRTLLGSEPAKVDKLASRIVSTLPEKIIFPVPPPSVGECP